MEESCFGKCRRKRNTADEVESKGQSSASCTVYCPARRSSTTQKGVRIPCRVYVRTYVHPRTYTFVRPHMCSHEQHPQTCSGSPHNACISLVYNAHETPVKYVQANNCFCPLLQTGPEPLSTKKSKSSANTSTAVAEVWQGQVCHINMCDTTLRWRGM